MVRPSPQESSSLAAEHAFLNLHTQLEKGNCARTVGNFLSLHSQIRLTTAYLWDKFADFLTDILRQVIKLFLLAHTCNLQLLRTQALSYPATAATTMATTVHVKNIGSQTEDKEIKDFFSFW